jgi:DNA mismatch repair protein MutS
MYDLERLNRRISLGKLHPYEINFLLDSLESSKQLNELLSDSSHTVTQGLREVSTNVQAAIDYLSHTFDTDAAAAFLQSAIDTSFFNTGVDAELDGFMNELSSLETKLALLKETYESLLYKSTGKDATGSVEIKQLDKDGHHLTMTKSRYALIQDQIKETFVSIDGTVYALADCTHKQLTSTVKITSPLIDEISDAIVLVQKKIVARVKTVYSETLERISHDYGALIDTLVEHIARIDVAQANAHTAREYVLTRPTILACTEEASSFLSLIDVRHPLVEAREDRGMYIPNSVVLGDQSQVTETDTALFTDTPNDTHGLLIYGINSSGKSSLMKSIGVSVLLAQAGCYVPATSMRFTLFRELFTRIIAKDNFEKGLSSFAVEMVELKNIFNRATNRSLILGDEISHGTETISAISIVSATILRLIEAQSLFLFTTHLHQLMDVPALQDVTAMQPVHLQVHYDKEKDLLVFDRTLQPGSGTSVYGLEFAQSLHMDETFLKHAMKIRKELAGELSDIELLTKRNTSKYNRDVFLTSCAICNSAVDDTHHISEQHTADETGKIGHVDKNHTYNLLPICKPCHDQIHAGEIRVQGFVMTSEGLKLSFES